MPQLHDLAIRCFLDNRVLSGQDVDQMAFQVAVGLYRKWSHGASEQEARDAVAAIILDAIHSDPSWFWKDVPRVTSAEFAAA